MTKGVKIAIISAVVAGGGIALYFIFKGAAKQPVIRVTNLKPEFKTATIIIGKKSFEYKFKPGFLDLGKVNDFYTAQVVAYAGGPDGADYFDVKLMKNGKLVDTKQIYIG